jgi:serine phosphatase RsbU (regulator of sigma subunit)
LYFIENYPVLILRELGGVLLNSINWLNESGFGSTYFIQVFSTPWLNILFESVLFLFLFIWLSRICPIKNQVNLCIRYPLSMLLLLYYGPLYCIVFFIGATVTRRVAFQQQVSWREELPSYSALLVSLLLILLVPASADVQNVRFVLVLLTYQIVYFFAEIIISSKAKGTKKQIAQQLWRNGWPIYLYIFFDTMMFMLFYRFSPFITTIIYVSKGIAIQYFTRNFYLLEKQNEMLHKKRQEQNRQELQLARQVQLQLLKPTPRIIEGWRIDANYCSAKEVGGDYYDIAYTDHGKIRLLIADVMGKGLGASLLMATLSAVVRTRIVRAESPKDLLFFINTHLYENLRASTAFITIFCIDIDPKTGQVTYCNAGHHPPLLRQSNGNIREFSDGKNASIGMLSNQSFKEGTDFIGKDDYLLFYTDGAIEIREECGMFGKKGIQTYLSKWNTMQPLSEITKCLIEELLIKSRHSLQDDITLLSISFESNQASFENGQTRGGEITHATL